MLRSLGVELPKVYSPGVVTFDAPVAGIPLENIGVRIAPSRPQSACKGCLRPYPSGARKTRKVARCHDRLVCGRTAQVIPQLFGVVVGAEIRRMPRGKPFLEKSAISVQWLRLSCGGFFPLDRLTVIKTRGRCCKEARSATG